ncbi:hypothetical protein M3Y99_01938100 [Aphelenchoides fujianensis]|nr:hypothetical protein M3Y99_01938100 [Aphelenchoides fujianensis]
MARRQREIRMTAQKPPPTAGGCDQNTQNKRLKPLYDSIDAGRCKDAIDIADKIVRKFSTKDRGNLNDRVTVTTAKALKALALIRTENASDAAPLIEASEQAMLTDEFNEGTLQVLFHCFKESYLPNRIPLLLENILRGRTATENLLNELYFGYARVCDFKNQQKIANMLFRDFKQNKYLIWAATSVVMQAISNSSLSEKIFYPLAQGMLEKGLADRQHTRAEVHLYFHVLWSRGACDKALEYIQKGNEKTNESISDLERERLMLDALESSDRFDELRKYARELIEQSGFVNFAPWKALLALSEKHIERGDLESFKKMLPEYEELVRLSDEQAGNSVLLAHGRKLLQNMILRLIVRSGCAKTDELKDFQPNFGSFVENTKAIVKDAFNRPYCFKDVSQFFSMLTEGDKQQILEFVDAEFGARIDEQIKEGMLGYEFVLREQLRTGFGFYARLDAAKRRAVALDLLNVLRKQDAATPNLEDYAKNIAIVIANLLWEVYAETTNRNYLYEAAVMLEYVIDRCPNVYVAGLLLMRVYSVLGNMQRIMTLFNKLDIKYIQRDSLGYLTFTSAVQFGRFKEAIYYYTSMTTQFDQNERETSESIVTANKVGSLEKIPQLVQFMERCRNSLYARGADVLNQLLSACFAVENFHLAVITLHGDDERIEWNKITDPRDFGAIECFAISDDRTTEKVRQMSFAETLDYIRFFHLLGRLVGKIGTADVEKIAFDADYAALRSHFDFCKSAYPRSECATYLQGFAAPALVSLVQFDVMTPVFSLLDVCARLMALEERKAEVSLHELLLVSSEVFRTPDFRLLMDQCTLSSRTADFVANCSHSLLLMTLSAMLIKFMEARARFLIPQLKPTADGKPEVDDEQLAAEFRKAARLADAQPNSTTNGATAERPEGDERPAEATGRTGGKKAKKQKSKTFEEMTVEEKIPEAFRIAYGQLIQTVGALEERMRSASELLDKTISFRAEDCLDFEAEGLGAYVTALDQSLRDSHRRTLTELLLYTARIQTFFRAQNFQLISVRFVGSEKSVQS